MASFSDLV